MLNNERPNKKDIYLNNPKLKKVGVSVSITEEQLEEYVKCKNDPIYFIQNYVKIVTLDRGFVQIDLYPFQEQTIRDIQNNRFVVMKAGRQVGKTTTVVGYIVWYILFEEDKLIALLANKAKTSREILNRIKLAYESLPLWLQQGVSGWNKGDIELENKCRILADSTASSAARGYSINFLYLDEFAFVPNNVAEEFFTSVYPTISSGKTSKVLISSTPNGMNHFYRIWKEAEEEVNGFHTIEANWRQVPGRTEEWALEQKRVLGEQKFLQEMECTFLGSAGTLISAGALGNLVFGRPLRSIMEGLDVYDEPEPNHFYISTVDTARGVGLDYSAFVIVDVTAQPFKVVAKYRSNVVSPLLFPNIIVQAARYYHDAYLLIENNDIGSQIAMVVHNELEYENMFHGEESGNIKYRMNGRFNLSQFGKTKQLGVKTTKKVKRQGCNTLKDLIENQRLLIPDFNIIEELSTFVLLSSGYYGAEEGSHDDLAMCLVLFSWLTTQPYFRDMTNFDIRKKLYDEKMQQMEDELPPIPLMSSGFETDNGQKYFKDGGLMWENIGESNSDFNSYADDFFKFN